MANILFYEPRVRRLQVDNPGILFNEHGLACEASGTSHRHKRTHLSQSRNYCQRLIMLYIRAWMSSSEIRMSQAWSTDNCHCHIGQQKVTVRHQHARLATESDPCVHPHTKECIKPLLAVRIEQVSILFTSPNLPEDICSSLTSQHQT
jgi:hypothetical protein